jgi:hypothetical protein
MHVIEDLDVFLERGGLDIAEPRESRVSGRNPGLLRLGSGVFVILHDATLSDTRGCVR